jgi:outer membrane protein assembly factor BamB
MKNLLATIALTLAMVLSVQAQDKPVAPTPAASDGRQSDAPIAPKDLPGRGLGEHDFLYAGEAKDRKVFIIVKSRVVWMYDDPAGKGEISDATRLSNGNLLIAHQFAVKLITPDKKVMWNYDAPKGTEIHTAVPIGKEHVLFVQNGDPALLRVINIVTNKIEKEFPLPVKNPKSVHGQFRHARLTADGTVVVAHMDLGKVVEYDSSGKELWSVPAPGAWGVTPLKNGNFLIVDRADIREVNRNHETVWSCGKTEIPGYKLSNLQLAWRLPNGNTLINNWVNQWSGPIDPATAPVQAIELSPDKKVVWALRSWSDPNLGPATTIQILDDNAQAPENVAFGDVR